MSGPAITGYRDDLPDALKQILRDIVHWDLAADGETDFVRRNRLYRNKDRAMAAGLEQFPENWFIYHRDHISGESQYHFASLAGFPNPAKEGLRLVVHAPSRLLNPGEVFYPLRHVIGKKIAESGNHAPILAERINPWPEDLSGPLSADELLTDLAQALRAS